MPAHGQRLVEWSQSVLRAGVIRSIFPLLQMRTLRLREVIDSSSQSWEVVELRSEFFFAFVF